MYNTDNNKKNSTLSVCYCQNIVYRQQLLIKGLVISNGPNVGNVTKLSHPKAFSSLKMHFLHYNFGH